MIIWISKLKSIFSTTWKWYFTTSTSHILDEIEEEVKCMTEEYFHNK